MNLTGLQVQEYNKKGYLFFPSLLDVDEINKLKEKRITEENEARRKLDKIHKSKIIEAERDRSNRIEEARRIIEKKLKEEERNRRLKEEQERKEKADETRKIQIEEVRRSEEIEKENLKAMEERISSNPPEQEKKDQN